MFSSVGGYIGNVIVLALKPILGSAGVWVSLFVLFFLSIILIFEERFFIVIKKCFVIPNNSNFTQNSSNDAQDRANFSKKDEPLNYDEIFIEPDINLKNVKNADIFSEKPEQNQPKLKRKKEPNKISSKKYEPNFTIFDEGKTQTANENHEVNSPSQSLQPEHISEMS